jgi:hypothetical protein
MAQPILLTSILRALETKAACEKHAISSGCSLSDFETPGAYFETIAFQCVGAVLSGWRQIPKNELQKK